MAEKTPPTLSLRKSSKLGNPRVTNRAQLAQEQPKTVVSQKRLNAAAGHLIEGVTGVVGVAAPVLKGFVKHILVVLVLVATVLPKMISMTNYSALLYALLLLIRGVQLGMVGEDISTFRSCPRFAHRRAVLLAVPNDAGMLEGMKHQRLTTA